jgi:pimeloyl-ACP methyl ester carboxylesterase
MQKRSMKAQSALSEQLLITNESLSEEENVSIMDEAAEDDQNFPVPSVRVEHRFHVLHSEIIDGILQCQEIQIFLPPHNMKVAGKLFQRLEQNAVTDEVNNHLAFALHGWLDNANSFLPLARKLVPSARNWRYMICIDALGCGKSDHKNHSYMHLEEVYEIHKIIEIVKNALNCHGKITGIGHSYGAGQLMIYASVYPEYVKELILLDSMGYVILPAEHAIHQFKATAKKRLQIDHRLEQNKPIRQTYASHKDLVDKLVSRFRNGSVCISRESASILVDRGSKYIKSKGGWQFTYDQYHLSSIWLRLTEEQLHSFLKKLNCPTLLLWCDTGLLATPEFKPVFEQRLSLIRQVNPFFKDICLDNVKGHHFHMDYPQETTEAILQYLSDQQKESNEKEARLTTTILKSKL